MKKRNHPANVVDVSSRIMRLLGRRKVDPTTDAMKAFKPDFIVSSNPTGIGHDFYESLSMTPADVPRFAIPLHLQQCGRFMRQPGLTPDEQQRLIDVLERMLA